MRAVSGARGKDWLQPAGHDTGVKVYNSLTQRKDSLIVGSADAASWYLPGIVLGEVGREGLWAERFVWKVGLGSRVENT